MNVTPHQQNEAIKRRKSGDESLIDIERSFSVILNKIFNLMGNHYYPMRE